MIDHYFPLWTMLIHPLFTIIVIDHPRWKLPSLLSPTPGTRGYLVLYAETSLAEQQTPAETRAMTTAGWEAMEGVAMAIGTSNSW